MYKNCHPTMAAHDSASQQQEEALASTRLVVALFYFLFIAATTASRLAAAGAVGYLTYAGLAYAASPRLSSSRRVTFGVHVADLIAAALVLMSTGSREIAAALCLVPLVAGATRWAISGALVTLAITIVMVIIAPHSAASSPAISVALLAGATIAALVVHPKPWRAADDPLIVALRRRCETALSFKVSLRQALGGIAREFHAHTAEVVFHQPRTGRTFAWTFSTTIEGSSSLRWDEVASPVSAQAARAHDAGEPVLMASFASGRWSGFVILVGVQVPARKRARATARLERAAYELAPILRQAYATSRLRARAATHERARLARALHDETIQSLIGAEMQIAALAKRADAEPAAAGQALGWTQRILRDEISSLRELMTRTKPLDLRPAELPHYVRRIVDRFAHDSGIACEFVGDAVAAPFDQRHAVGIARIVQEALANVRKHSGATRVVVMLKSSAAGGRLVVQDNGRGFAFEGRLSVSDATRLPGVRIPEAIHESVRTLDGDLIIHSQPGRGARLEITLPAAAAAAARSAFHRVAS
jgi:signal transduction histidine kinase